MSVFRPIHTSVCLLLLFFLQLLPSGKLKWDWVESRQTYFPHWYDLENGFEQKHIEKVHKIEYDETTKKHILPELE